MKPRFRKSFHRNLDSKGRLMLPPEYRDIISAATDSGGFMLTIYDECIVAYPMPEWEAFTEQIEQGQHFDKNTRRFRSLVLGRAEELELDPQGRVRISQSLMRYAGLNKDVVLVGLGNKFEIWDTQRYEGLKLDDDALDLVVKGLAQSGIRFPQ